MPTLAALETALNDYKRSQEAFSDLQNRQATVLAQLKTIEGQIETARTSFAANEDALRSVARQYAETRRTPP